MHVIAFNGSPHEKGNTYAALRAVTEQLEAAGITAEIVQVGHLPIRGCAACNQCARNKDSRCVLPEDGVNTAIEKIRAADGVLLGAPTYYGDVPGPMKSFLDRVFFAGDYNCGGAFRYKVGPPGRRAHHAGLPPAVPQLRRDVSSLHHQLAAGLRPQARRCGARYRGTGLPPGPGQEHGLAAPGGGSWPGADPRGAPGEAGISQPDSMKKRRAAFAARLFGGCRGATPRPPDGRARREAHPRAPATGVKSLRRGRKRPPARAGTSRRCHEWAGRPRPAGRRPPGSLP